MVVAVISVLFFFLSRHPNLLPFHIKLVHVQLPLYRLLQILLVKAELDVRFLLGCLLHQIHKDTILLKELIIEIDAELIDKALLGCQVFLCKVEVSEPQGRNLLDDALIIGDDEHLELEILIELLLVGNIHVKLLFKDVVIDLIMDGNDESIFLFDEPTRDLFEVTIALVVHV